MGRFATGVTVVTTARGGERTGMTANAVSSLSLEPPLVLVAVDQRAQFHGWLRETRCFALNVLAEPDEHLSRRFAAPGPKEFGDLEIRTALTGSPILQEALAWVDCRVVEILPGGDHDIFIGEILAGDAREGPPLIFYAGKYARLAE